MRVTGACVACALLACGAVACGGGPAGQRGPAELARARAALTRLNDPTLDFADHTGAPWRPPFRPADAECGRLFDFAEDGTGPGATAAAAEATSFQGDELGETAGVALAAYDPSGARRALRDVGRLMRHCSVARLRTAGGADRLVGSDLPVRSIADGVEARRFKGRVGGFPYEMHLVVVRSGDLLISLVHTGVAKLDPERTRRLATVVAARVQEAAQ
ncbi:hypothetical protein [Sphaerisporangium sp. TRM90804]|uniref:hypothetical protein n=1 Tax=Sphaerisporangium sp. TRM90804 TaxID=3031113 RepID=UPI00244883CE|nr:hypothetical protein [Sphaerisporangium sp. TRM90804]MDH2425061.1 hypothetical protein [Sphaerisporangium sp. TRM90804]